MSTVPNGATTLSIEPFFSGGKDPLADIVWNKRGVRRQDGEQTVIEVPEGWSDTAARVFASHYLRVINGERETSARQAIDRVARTVSEWALLDGYTDAANAHNLRCEVAHMLVHQMWSPNSPVWYNIGTCDKPQLSACFIASVKDSMESLSALQTQETGLFRGGSGVGTNYSALRHRNAPLSRGGSASGAASFLRGFDAWAGVTKSGGGTRRAAKMNVLNVDHPDIEQYVAEKAEAERMAWDLVDAGWPSDYNGPVYANLPFQNANHSVRISDAFMKAVDEGAQWDLKDHAGNVVKSVDARGLWDQICTAAHTCGDPGLQFDDIINDWHTCRGTGRINASNPCCFTGDTLIDTAEGHIRFDELLAMQKRGTQLPLVFAHDIATNLPVLRRINKVWVAGKTSNLVEVSTDKGIKVRCTPEHKFLLRDGTYVEASNLRTGDRLRKINKTRNAHRANRVWINSRVRPNVPNGSQLLTRFMWEQAYGPIKDGHEIHHINEDPTDDRLSNLVSLPKKEHRTEHAEGSANPRFIPIEMGALVEIWEQIERLPKVTHKNLAKVTPTRWNLFVNNNGLKGVVPLAGSPTLGGRIQGMTWEEFSRKIEEHRSLVNDKIESVTPISCAEQETVYDMEVEGTHNFAVTDGALHSIVVSNSEYLFLDDSACNLASLNLRKYHDGKRFDVVTFEHACRISITAQEIFVDRASYPSKLIAKNSHLFRPLGLGYANLGALLMSLGLPYDSDKGRNLCAAVTSLMGAAAYSQSQEIAKVKGCGKGIAANEGNRKGIRWVLEKHCHASDELPSDSDGIAEHASEIWHYNVASSVLPRNAQVTVLAPTGTIAFGMDCDTTGIEPDFSLVKYKLLAGANAGYMTYANRSVEESLRTLGYSEPARTAILAYVADKQKIEGAPGLLDEHLPVFDCANRCAANTAEPGQRYLSPEAHLRMMAAAQPFLSGGISKTVNLPHDATVEDISRTYRLAHTLGIKCVALFRDNCKASQPIAGATQNRLNEHHPHVRKAIDTLAVAGGASPGMSLADAREALSKPRQPLRRRMPTVANSRRVKFSVGGHEGYLHLGMHEDGSLGEVFVRMAKEGSTVSGLLDAWATMVSIALQYGAPLETLCEKMVGTTYAPHGFTGDDLRHASSLTDYIGRYLAANFVKGEKGEKGSKGGEGSAHNASASAQETAKSVQAVSAPASAETCHNKLCGGSTRKAGSCRVCERCGTTTGCG